MSYRTDRYEVGDMVVPDKTYHSYSVIKELGDGPFKVKEVIEIPERGVWEDDYTYQSSRSSCGHVQQIVLENVNYDYGGDKCIFSGAYFRKESVKA